MFADTRPAALDAQGAEDPFGEFRVGHAGEIVALLRQLRDSQQPVVLGGPDGQSLTATLWSVDEQKRLVTFNAAAGVPALQSLVEADEGTAVAYMDSVKLQWDLHTLVLLRGPRLSSLQAALPATLYRFQRRDSFRVRTPARHAPVARLRHPALPDMALTLRVLDLSLGGCALWCPQDVPALQAGTRIGEITIELDAATRFQAPALLAHVSSLASHDRGVRVGCEWHPLPPQAERALQRWIDQAQRKRRLAALGG
jgi:flagellar brake protein